MSSTGSGGSWNQAGTPIPPEFVAGSDNYVNAYPGEEAIYTVDVSNYEQYADILTEGSNKNFQQYHDAMTQHFSEVEIAEIAAIVINMNLWNQSILFCGF